MIFAENKILNFIIKSIFYIFVCFFTISLITDSKVIFDITKGLFIIVAIYTIIKIIKDFIKDIEKIS